MNAHAHPDPRLSEKLSALSLTPAPAGSRPPKHRGGRTLSILCIVALTVAAAAVPILSGVRLDAVLDSLGSRADEASRPGALASDEATKATDTKATATRTPTPPPPAVPAVTGSGHVVALAEAMVHPRRGGTIVALDADVGDRVRAGQVLLRLDDPETVFARQAAELAQDRARLVLAARRFDRDEADASARRMAGLARSGAVNAQTAIDTDGAARRAANLVDQGAQDLAGADLALERARQAVSDLTITAPIAGVVTARSARLGEAILAQIDARGDAPLFTITDPDRLGIDVDIAETAVAALRPGLRGEAVLDGYPDQPFAVEVARIAPVASAERGTVSLRLTPLSPPPGIRPAMAVRVRIETDVATATSQGH
ncbi:efflux RND transporter periplasmic adaptor subunit [Aureimonas pseudogalii]|uniref:RND family efflux transporter MFP subunit n=1 Tax=Aureimonas pseudogalii TaxID=1744844 RepID=A0A7W6EE37_9HYPH|nr:efflux RND transporter periplasmic adaptor subunit [Aureimonas pseudogalii]MBB3998381.1 RND family efflux transporter MFP subunit [Aureimonas pseudogalii]